MTALFQDIDIFDKPVFETDDKDRDEKTVITRNIHNDEHETEIYDRARAIYWKARRQHHTRPANIL